MIADRLKNYKRYTGMHKDMEKGFQAIEQCLRGKLPEKNETIQVNGLNVVVQYYKTKEYEEKKFEGHRKCIDIQYMVKGKETIYWANTDGMTPCTEYCEEWDHLRYSNTDKNSPLHLEDGYFAIFLPDDSHKTGCTWGDAQDIVKLIVKVML